MKVTIQRTVELNEIPLQINKMVNDCIQQLDTISKVVTTVECTNPEVFLDQVDFLRRNLFSVDNKLEECFTLMKGYQQANQNAVAPAPIAPQESSHSETSAELYEQTVKKMEEVSKLMKDTQASVGDANE